MKNCKNIGSLLIAGLMLISSATLAQVTGVSNNVSNRNIAVGQTSNRTIVWSVSAQPIASTTLIPIGTITSPVISFRATVNNVLVTLGTVTKILSRTLPNGTPAGTFTLLENITIPSSIVYRANKLGATRIFIVRSFTDNGGVASSFAGIGTANLDISGSSAAGFTINAVSVRFDNNQPQRVIKRSKQHRAYIQFTYNGSGLLQGVWEIASPTTTIGRPIYRPLRVVRQHLPGTGAYKLYSPRLPTRMQGVYLVRFRITAPALGFNDPLIRYFVYTGKKPLLSPIHIFLVQPGPSTAVNTKTTFRWNKIKQASVLRLELYAIKKENSLSADLPSLGTTDKEKPQVNGKLIAGKLLRGSERSTKLSQLTLSRLKPGQWYLWRLVAFNKDGNIIGVSEPRKVYAPAK